MAKDTNRHIKANLRKTGFRKRIKEAKRMVQHGKKGDAAYHILKNMALDDDENSEVPSLIRATI